MYDEKQNHESLVEIPVKEHWLYKNPKAMASVIQGLEDIKAKRVNKLDRNFSEFINDELN